MPQSAMSEIAPSTLGVALGGRGDPAARALLRDAVLAGPASGVDIGPGLGSGLLRRLAGEQAVTDALARSGHVDGRRRTLTGEVTVAAVLGLCLFSGEGYDSVLARVLSDPPTASALSQARARLADDSMRELFEVTAADPAGLADGKDEKDEKENGRGRCRARRRSACG